MTYWVSFFLVSLILGIAYSVLGYFNVFNLTTATALSALTIVALISAGTFKILQSKLTTKGYAIVKGVISSLGIKMLITIMIVIFVKLKFPEIAFPFVGSYFFSYFIYTTLAVYYLLRNLRPQTESDKIPAKY